MISLESKLSNTGYLPNQGTIREVRFGLKISGKSQNWTNSRDNQGNIWEIVFLSFFNKSMYSKKLAGKRCNFIVQYY